MLVLERRHDPAVPGVKAHDRRITGCPNPLKEPGHLSAPWIMGWSVGVSRATFAAALLPLLAPASPIIATSGPIAPLVRRTLLCLSWLCRTSLHWPALALNVPEGHCAERLARRTKSQALLELVHFLQTSPQKGTLQLEQVTQVSPAPLLEPESPELDQQAPPLNCCPGRRPSPRTQAAAHEQKQEKCCAWILL